MPRHVKIVCTIGPAVEAPETVRRLILAGMDVARLNFSHGTWDEHAARIATIRREAETAGKPVAILQDLQGPKIRTGPLRDRSVQLEEGAQLTITTAPVPGGAACVSTSYQDLPGDVHPGDRILLDDGSLELQVERVEGTDVLTRIMHGGILGEHKGINLPGVEVSAPSLTEKDRLDLEFGLDQEVDLVALSFVRSRADVDRVRDIVARRGLTTPVIAKIEKPQAMARLDEIVDASDGVMVARGDLAVETAPEAVPLFQKEIIREANRRGKFVITATQMLESMIVNPRPTRAEASDVANAVLDGTDAVMLSAETAVGRFPVECVGMMDRIACTAEARYADFGTPSHPDQVPGVQGALIRVVEGLTGHVSEIVALVTHTQSGRSALLLSKERPMLPILALTSNRHSLRRMAAYWGVTPLLVDPVDSTDALLACIETRVLAEGAVKPGDLVAVFTGSPPGTTSNLLKLHRVAVHPPR